MENLRVASPCKASWERMAGDDRVRHCTLCDLNVYNFAELTRDEIRELLLKTEGRVCGRLYRRADGTLLTRDCPSGIEALRRRVSQWGAAIVAAMMSVPAFAFDTKPRVKPGTNVTFKIEQAATPQQAVLTGTVLYEAKAPLPGVTVVLRDEATKRELTTFTDEHGVFIFKSVNDGVYRVEAILEAFEPAVVEHLVLKQNEVTHASFTLHLQAMLGEVITLGRVQQPH